MSLYENTLIFIDTNAHNTQYFPNYAIIVFLFYAYSSCDYGVQDFFWLATFSLQSGRWPCCEGRAGASVTQYTVVTSFPEAAQKARARASKLKRNFHWER